MQGQRASSPGVTAETLAAVGMPERRESPFGALEFFDGLPLPDTVQRSYDALDLMRGVEVFLNCMPGASMVAAERERPRGIRGRHRIDPGPDCAPVVDAAEARDRPTRVAPLECALLPEVAQAIAVAARSD